MCFFLIRRAIGPRRVRASKLLKILFFKNNTREVGGPGASRKQFFSTSGPRRVHVGSTSGPRRGPPEYVAAPETPSRRFQDASKTSEDAPRRAKTPPRLPKMLPKLATTLPSCDLSHFWAPKSLLDRYFGHFSCENRLQNSKNGNKLAPKSHYKSMSTMKVKNQLNTSRLAFSWFSLEEVRSKINWKNFSLQRAGSLHMKIFLGF